MNSFLYTVLASQKSPLKHWNSSPVISNITHKLHIHTHDQSGAQVSCIFHKATRHLSPDYLQGVWLSVLLAFNRSHFTFQVRQSREYFTSRTHSHGRALKGDSAGTCHWHVHHERGAGVEEGAGYSLTYSQFCTPVH